MARSVVSTGIKFETTGILKAGIGKRIRIPGIEWEACGISETGLAGILRRGGAARGIESKASRVRKPGLIRIDRASKTLRIEGKGPG